MAKPNVIYEWVVETIAKDGSGDILDCSYWPLNERNQADAQFKTLKAEGHLVDFGLHRRVGDDAVGDESREYIYRDENGQWPADRKMDGGAIVPKYITL